MKLKFSKNLERFLRWDYDLDDGITRGVKQSALLIQNSAKRNAPYDKGTLRRSISTDFRMIRAGLAKIWSPVKYARKREFVNNKNPHRKYYFKRAKEENEDEITTLIKGNFKLIFW